jgi:uridylate kinase
MSFLKEQELTGFTRRTQKKNHKATKFDNLSFDEVLKKGLKIMDTTAFTLSQENKLPIIVFDMNTPNNLDNVLKGKNVGTRVDL